jgi:hypothetical protein
MPSPGLFGVVTNREESPGGRWAEKWRRRIGMPLGVITLLSLGLFLARGPYKALVTEKGVHNESIDFGPVFGATRAWLHGKDPYDTPTVISEFRAGGGTKIINPNVYFPTLLPFAAIASWAPWETAIRIWLAMGLLAWGFAIWGVATLIRSTAAFKYMVFLYGLASWPAAMNIRWGQPSTVCCALTIWSVWLSLRNRWWLSGILLGLAACWKPTIAVAAVFVFLVQRSFRPLLVGAGTFGAVYACVILSALPSSLRWAAELRGIMASSVVYEITGSEVIDFVNFQPLVGVFTGDRIMANGISYALVGAILLTFMLKIRHLRANDIPAEKLALAVPLALLVVYHRYPDLFLLIGALPLCFVLYRQRRYRLLAVIGGIIAALSVPVQTMAGLIFEPVPRNHHPLEVLRVLLLFHHQQMLLVAMAVVVCFTISGAPDGHRLRREGKTAGALVNPGG